MSVGVCMLVGDSVCNCTTHEQCVVYCVNVSLLSLMATLYGCAVLSEKPPLGTKLKPCIEVLRIHPFLCNTKSPLSFLVYSNYQGS